MPTHLAYVCLFFETGFLCVALAVLELTPVDPRLELRDLPTSASQMLGLKTWVTTTQLIFLF